jgi:multicomponent Na+:H+ antiporter subunit D
VATVVVSILIMYNRGNRAMRDGMIYLMANTVAIQFYLLGIGYIYKLTGTLDMATAASVLSHAEKSSLLLPYALVMTSISLKCALMPLYSWLPKAHGSPGAPSSVSAILSGLHIKSGIFLFIRFQEVFQGIDLTAFFLAAGIITGIVGFVLAISQTDMKLTLAYSTISQIGMIMIGLNVNNTYSYHGAVYHILNHALFKTSLFLSAGVISRAYGSRNIYEIKGAFKRMPLIGIATAMAILGITGAPFFNGSISKYFISSNAGLLINGAIIFINLGTIVTFIKYSSMFFGNSEPMQCNVVIRRSKYAAILVLSAFTLAGGIFGVQAVKLLFDVDLNIDTAGYIEKAALFALSVVSGYLIFKYYIQRSAFFKKIRELELSFRGICVSIGTFFALVLLVAYMS